MEHNKLFDIIDCSQRITKLAACLLADPTNTHDLEYLELNTKLMGFYHDHVSKHRAQAASQPT